LSHSQNVLTIFTLLIVLFLPLHNGLFAPRHAVVLGVADQVVHVGGPGLPQAPFRGDWVKLRACVRNHDRNLAGGSEQFLNQALNILHLGWNPLL
jgi:hypothetical protein